MEITRTDRADKSGSIATFIDPNSTQIELDRSHVG